MAWIFNHHFQAAASIPNLVVGYELLKRSGVSKSGRRITYQHKRNGGVYRGGCLHSRREKKHRHVWKKKSKERPVGLRLVGANVLSAWQTLTQRALENLERGKTGDAGSHVARGSRRSGDGCQTSFSQVLDPGMVVSIVADGVCFSGRSAASSELNGASPAFIRGVFLRASTCLPTLLDS